jgi:hypothetical protein
VYAASCNWIRLSRLRGGRARSSTLTPYEDVGAVELIEFIMCCAMQRVKSISKAKSSSNSSEEEAAEKDEEREADLCTGGGGVAWPVCSPL